jgi:cytoskeletal protein CcmA (bactofilin family)
VEISKTGSLEGDLVTPRIVIEDGAVFRGSIDILKSGGQDANSSSKRADGVATPRVVAAAADSGSAMAKSGAPFAPKQ